MIEMNLKERGSTIKLKDTECALIIDEDMCFTIHLPNIDEDIPLNKDLHSHILFFMGLVSSIHKGKLDKLIETEAALMIKGAEKMEDCGGCCPGCDKDCEIKE